MKIALNNREEEFDGDQMTVTEMLEVKKFTYKLRIIKINGIFIPKEKYNDTVICDADNVQMFYLMSGG